MQERNGLSVSRRNACPNTTIPPYISDSQNAWIATWPCRHDGPSVQNFHTELVETSAAAQKESGDVWRARQYARRKKCLF